MLKKIYLKIKLKVVIAIEYLITIIKNSKNTKKINQATEKNIMILVSSLSNGGAERVAVSLAEELDKKYNVILVTYQNRQMPEYKCNVKRIKMERIFNKHKNYYRIRILKRLKKQYNITHTISFCTKANFFNVMSKNEDKTIISIRNYISAANEGMKKNILNKISCKLCDKIIAVSELVKQDEIKRFGANKEKIEVIYNYCDKNKINQILNKDNKTEKLENKKYIINIGRLEYQKAQNSLIKAFSIVKKENPQLNLVILGEGKQKDKLNKLIIDLGLEDSIYILGYKKNPYKYLKNAEIFILNSRYEGMSNALLEAMACEIPIISTDCKAGTREILAPDTDLTKNTKEIEKAKYRNFNTNS